MRDEEAVSRVAISEDCRAPVVRRRGRSRKLDYQLSRLRPKSHLGALPERTSRPLTGTGPKGTTLETAATDFLDFCRLQNLTGNAVGSYQDGLEGLMRYVGTGRDIAAIGACDLRRFIAHLQESGYAAKTVKTRRQCLTRFFGWLVEEEYLEVNPAERLPRVRVEVKHTPPHTVAEVQTMLNQCDTSTEQGLRDALLILILCDTAGRESEVRSIRLDDIDIDGMRIRIMGKGRKERYLNFSQITKLALGRYLRRYVAGCELPPVYLFESARCPGRPLSRERVYRIVRNTGEAAGVANAYPHRLRSTYATEAHSAGADVLTIQREMGHADPKTTQGYIASHDPDVKRKHQQFSPASKLVLRRHRDRAEGRRRP